MEELQARCAELREARDNYREKWARGVMAGSGGLLEFWDAVENTSREIKQLYQGIDKLSRLLGVADGVMDTPQILERILAQVSDSVEDVKYPSPAIQILGLRVANMAAQTQIATLRVKLEQAQQPKTDAEMQAFLGVVDEEEVERRVSNRTQTYRQHRCQLLRHIFDAQVEFLALARRSGGNRAAIEKLVGQYLEPSSLPMIQPVQVDLV
ncbi:hypothetical protein GGR50DRAFT_640168 [Xylaria sp. CBS 124048]|nr:hypothetical protein GGR50DRAFT_640168 [Xylaria sp. CBS 124048]